MKKKKTKDRRWFAAEWLEHLGLKQADIVARTKYSKSQVSEYVSGQVGVKPKIMEVFAYAMGIQPGQLLAPPPTEPDDELSRVIAALKGPARHKALRVLKALDDDAEDEQAA
jgi:hypothetical protein